MKKFIVTIPSGIFSLLITMVVAYFTLASNPLNINSVKLFPEFDKFAHFVMYFACTLTYLSEYAKYKLPHHTELNVELAITAFACVMGLFFEVAQMALTNEREFEFLDCLANAVGAITAFGLMRCWGMHIVRETLYNTVTRRRHHHRHKKYRETDQD